MEIKTELLIILGVVLLLAFLLLFISIRYKKKLNKINEDYYKTLELDYLEKIEADYIDLDEQFHLKKEDLEKQLNQLKEKISTNRDFNENLLRIREEELERLIDQKREEKIKEVDREVKEWARSAQEAANINFSYRAELFNKDISELEEAKHLLEEEVKDFQTKRDVINQEILRSRAIKENQSFYSIQLDDDSKQDIKIFQEIKPRIIKIEKLNKLIYDNYINKPATEMIKRVLEGENPSGIYKVTNIETNEIYIGKSSSVADRWKNHIKSAYGLAGVADSQFQRALKTYGIENFTWELLEKISKEKLTEREKYYINFYDTIHYGYNQRLG